MSADGLYRISIFKEDPGLIRARIQTRHVSAKKYILLISFNEHATPPINDWYCQCKVGSRTVGCCAHVAAVLRYLGYQRHQMDVVLSETNYCGAVLDAADTDWDSDVD